MSQVPGLKAYVKQRLERHTSRVQMASYLGQEEVEKMVTTWMHGAAVKLMGGDIFKILSLPRQTSAVQPTDFEGNEAEWAAVPPHLTPS
jgi:hypothetical protein